MGLTYSANEAWTSLFSNLAMSLTASSDLIRHRLRTVSSSSRAASKA